MALSEAETAKKELKITKKEVIKILKLLQERSLALEK